MFVFRANVLCVWLIWGFTHFSTFSVCMCKYLLCFCFTVVSVLLFARIYAIIPRITSSVSAGGWCFMKARDAYSWPAPDPKYSSVALTVLQLAVLATFCVSPQAFLLFSFSFHFRSLILII